jgi:hypothetical protein
LPPVARALHGCVVCPGLLALCRPKRPCAPESLLLTVQKLLARWSFKLNLQWGNAWSNQRVVVRSPVTQMETFTSHFYSSIPSSVHVTLARTLFLFQWSFPTPLLAVLRLDSTFQWLLQYFEFSSPLWPLLLNRVLSAHNPSLQVH